MTVSRYRMKHSGPECQHYAPRIWEGDCLVYQHFGVWLAVEWCAAT